MKVVAAGGVGRVTWVVPDGQFSVGVEEFAILDDATHVTTDDSHGSAEFSLDARRAVFGLMAVTALINLLIRGS